MWDLEGTVGSGNHFVELQVVDAVLDRKLAYAAGLRVGEAVVMLHSGSRDKLPPCPGRFGLGSHGDCRTSSSVLAGWRFPANLIAFPIAYSLGQCLTTVCIEGVST